MALPARIRCGCSRPLVALSWLTLPCALKAAIGIGKRTLGDLASLPRHRRRSKALGLYRGSKTSRTIATCRAREKAPAARAAPRSRPNEADRERVCCWTMSGLLP